MNMIWQRGEFPALEATPFEVADHAPQECGALPYDVTMRLAVRDVGLLWRMAAARALTFGTLSDIEIEEMLGPLEDPSITDCITMLVGPREMTGCSCEHFAISPVAVG